MKKVQPAKISYFFNKGYVDLKNTILDAWGKNKESMSKQRLAISSSDRIAGKLVHIVALLCIVVFGSIITAMTTLLHVMFLSVFFVIVYIMFSFVWFIDRIYIMIHKISNACPNPDCQDHFLIPAYECSECKRVHTRLMPGKYGILHRTCLCGNKMPTTFLNGRSKLTAYCPTCAFALEGDTGSRQIAIPVIGGPSVGKTCLINMAVNKMATETAKEKNWEMSFASDEDRSEFNTVMDGLNTGIRPNKTDKDALTAYQIMMNLPNDKVGRRVYIYDISGERFSESATITGNQAFGYADGFVFVIDPLTIPEYVMSVIDKVDPDKYGASPQDFDDIFDIMMNNLQIMFKLDSDDILKRSFAIVINKADIPGLEEEIGDTAAQNYLISHEECRSFEEARNAVCKQFLENNGEGNFVRAAEGRFKTVQYFTCSALGHNKEGVPFSCINAELPFLWIMQQVDSKIR